MNSSLVKSAPQGEFMEVSALVKSWEAKLRALAGQRKPIKFDVYPLSKVPEEIFNLLKQQGYQDLILENDRWQHFLVPAANDPRAGGALNASGVDNVREPSLSSAG